MFDTLINYACRQHMHGINLFSINWFNAIKYSIKDTNVLIYELLGFRPRKWMEYAFAPISFTFGILIGFIMILFFVPLELFKVVERWAK